MKKDWEIVLMVPDPGAVPPRPRRLSLHTIAYVCGRDALTILHEMKDSGLVDGYVCPDVKTPIFFLKANKGMPGMITSGSFQKEVWEKAVEWLEKFPTDRVKGFKRFAAYARKTDGTVDWNNYNAKATEADYASEEAFEPADAPYKAALDEALKALTK